MAAGQLKAGDTIIEPTLGDSGVGLALAASLNGMRFILVLPDSVPEEKILVHVALGALVIRTPASVAPEDEEGYQGVARRLQAAIPNSHVFDVFASSSTALAHYDGTAVEILDVLENQVDMVVMFADRGGALAGLNVG
ncbi:hypothetical protein ATCC90586_010750 [Pythium insidiosum]|nr:hypothetical protein ATCC90586_010750 [Pythium insidiosum]